MERWQYMSLVIAWDDRRKIFTLRIGGQEYASNIPADLLNSIGAEGWELVSFAGDSWAGGPAGYTNTQYIAMLKRKY